jgi:hypothetical protein
MSDEWRTSMQEEERTGKETSREDAPELDVTDPLSSNPDDIPAAHPHGDVITDASDETDIGHIGGTTGDMGGADIDTETVLGLRDPNEVDTPDWDLDESAESPAGR